MALNIMGKTYILKHKDYPVMRFILDEDYQLEKIEKIFNEERLPFGLKYKGNENAYFRQTADWLEKRGLPESRQDLPDLKFSFKAGSSTELAIGSYALNLSDHYWAHNIEKEIKWKDVNFFDNNFDGVIDFDTSFFDHPDKTIIAPDLTVDGSLRKSWVCTHRAERYLIKESRYDERQEPFNEVIASKIMDEFNINHVTYNLIRSEKKNVPLSICRCMVDQSTEFITAQYVLDCEEKKNRNNYDRFIEICVKNGIKDAKERLDEMIAVDFLIGNTDRHTGNFGIIRNADSLQWLRIAPLFDNGNSLFYNERDVDNIKNRIDSHCRWFRDTNAEKLKLTGYPAWYSSDKANKIPEIVYTELEKNENSSRKKAEIVADIVKQRITILEKKIGIK